MTDAAPDGPAAVVGQRVVVTDRVRALRILAVCALTSYWMWRGRYEWLLYSAVLVALQVRVVKQPPSVVSAQLRRLERSRIGGAPRPRTSRLHAEPGQWQKPFTI